MGDIDITAASDGELVEADVGNVIVVRLEENPSTGFRWFLDELPGNLEAVGDAYTPFGPAVGAGGMRTLTFHVVSGGQGRIGLVRRREWQSEPKDDIFSVGINVATR